MSWLAVYGRCGTMTTSLLCFTQTDRFVTLAPSFIAGKACMWRKQAGAIIETQSMQMGRQILFSARAYWQRN